MLHLQLAVMPAPQPMAEASVARAAPAHPTAKEYCRWGLSARGARHVLALCTPAADSTTLEVCRTHIQTLTTPGGWEHRVARSDRGRHTHSYVEAATGLAQAVAPDGTTSLCALLAADPATAGLTGRPSAFFSHAWRYRFADLVKALSLFQAGRPANEPEIFFWLDVCSIDQHKTGGWPQEWWLTTFREAIELIGHTVMLLAPWDEPVPLTRAWCLWELFCSVSTSTKFSVCLGPATQADFEEAVLTNHRALLDAFSHIDVRAAQAGNPSDLQMILRAVESDGGCGKLNAVAMKEMRDWVSSVLEQMLAARRLASGVLVPGRLQEVSSIALLLEQLGDTGSGGVIARGLHEEVLGICTSQHGPHHQHTLRAKLNLATLLGELSETDDARRLYEEVVAGQCDEG